MQVFLCGHTGNINRGCEAIVRSTVPILGFRRGDISLTTFAPETDTRMAKELGIGLIPYANYPTQIHRYFSAGIRRLFDNPALGRQITMRPLTDRINKGDLCLNIGGDTYCYGRPGISYALNRYARKKGADTILWCCSIEKSAIDGEMLSDLKRYSFIFAREQITYSTLLDAGVDPQKLIKCCDPAFFLQPKSVPLPSGFVSGNTVGINLSEIVVNKKTPLVYESVKHLIRHLIDNTNYNICLIPHVYSIKEHRCDYPILKALCEEFNSPKISIVEEEYTCEELKYIISQCRFLVCARTHASIAAYSSFVPTLVLGYSVKSKGIATDLFGSHEDYVLPYDEIRAKETLLDYFLRLEQNEDEIKQQLTKVLPDYKKSLENAIDRIIRPKDSTAIHCGICNPLICTGCSACVSACPVSAISMQSDSEGFERPAIDASLCVNCNRCRQICPAANPPLDDSVTPKAYAAINTNLETRLQSSSGGIFSLLAEYILDTGGVVFGAAFNETFQVVHKPCATKDGLRELRGSKYVQSKIGDTYLQAKNKLLEGIPVLFTGTPCQIAGLHAFLGKEYSNLFTQDLVCHGVPSPLAFSHYLDEIERKTASKPNRIFFRDKETGWKKYSVHIQCKNSNTYSSPVTQDPYMLGFVHDLFCRPSCNVCRFRQIHRQSDITLADFWGVENIVPELNDDKGTSLVLIHSQKGQALFSAISDKLSWKALDYAPALSSNPSAHFTADSSPFRTHFFRKINRNPFSRIVYRYYGKGLFPKIRRAVKRFLHF